MSRPFHSASCVLLLLMSSCSLIDDFDKFHGRARDVDSGAEGDAGDMDSSVGDDGGVDGSAEAAIDGGADSGLARGDEQCAGKARGTPCGTEGTLLCLGGFCRTSRCGDGYVNAAAGEQCDDANLLRGDGCEPSCLYSCEDNSDCDNLKPCDGQELCDLSTHSCVADDEPITNIPCTRPGGLAGVCHEPGYCVVQGCGDGDVDMGEECDPQDPATKNGCRPDCTKGCTSDAQCRDSNLCNGNETCDLSVFDCKAGRPLVCNDGDACTSDDECVPETGCTPRLIDGDGDGYASATCAPGSQFKGGDCNDGNSAVFPGAEETCDGNDNNCNAMVDEGAVESLCYPDRDRDGYPARSAGERHCVCPEGTHVARGDGAFDCFDDPRGGADVHPGQTSYFTTGYPCGPGNATCFDYDCSGEPVKDQPKGNGSCGLLGLTLVCSGVGGYKDPTSPACGVAGSYLVCSDSLVGCSAATVQRTQACR